MIQNNCLQIISESGLLNSKLLVKYSYQVKIAPRFFSHLKAFSEDLDR